MLLIWSLLLVAVSIRAEEDYFLKTNYTTWNDARRQCQECYKELVTITPSNAQWVAKLVGGNMSLDYWIGLRQNLSGSILWSQWANGAPVVYQNWYPGHPVLKQKPVPMPTCPAPCNTTSILSSCPSLVQILRCLNAENCTDNVVNCSIANYTAISSGLTFVAQTPVPISTSANVTVGSNETDSEYIDNSCVAILGFGMWKEKNCSTRLPFICYDDRFYGDVNISNVTQNGAYLSWSRAPGVNVSHYNVKITGQQPTNVGVWAEQINNAQTRTYTVSDWSNISRTETIKNPLTDEPVMGKQIEMLEPGTIYRVQIVPVRCNRTLNPQNVSFYTLPQKVSNLTVLEVKANEITLNWSKPYGGLDFYLVNVSEMPPLMANTEKFIVTNLKAGIFYHIQVSAVVNNTTFGVPDDVDVYTRPSPVVNLTSSNNETDKIIASWSSTDLNHQNYLYNVRLLGNNNQTGQTTITLSDLVPGTKYILNVSALANGTVEGEAVTITAYTNPMTVEGLELQSTEDSINASWQSSKGNFTFFCVVLFTSNGSQENRSTNITYYNFTSLKAAALYKVNVITYVDGLSSAPASKSIYTRPVKPGTATVQNINSTAVNLSWIVPQKSEGVPDIKYSVKYFTSFWGESDSRNVTGNNYLIISGLRPGTKYYYNITVLAGTLESCPSETNKITEPNKRSLTLTMLCSSATQLNCIQNSTMEAILKKLSDTIFSAYKEDIVWSLKWKNK